MRRLREELAQVCVAAGMRVGASVCLCAMCAYCEASLQWYAILCVLARFLCVYVQAKLNNQRLVQQLQEQQVRSSRTFY